MYAPKKWACYTITGTLPAVDVLQQNIAEHPEIQMPDHMMSHTGFTTPVGLDIQDDNQTPRSVLIKDRYLVFALKYQARKVPKNIIEQRLQAWRREYRQRTGSPPKSGEVHEQKQIIFEKLAPQYPPEQKIIEGALDLKRKLIMWSESKPSIIEIGNNRIRGSANNMGFAPGFAPSKDVDAFEHILTAAFQGKEPAPLIFGESITLTGDDGERVSGSGIYIEEASNLQELVNEGYGVARIEFLCETAFGYARFNMDCKQAITSWCLLSAEREKISAKAHVDSFREQCFANLTAFDSALTQFGELVKNLNLSLEEATQKPRSTENETHEHDAGALQEPDDRYYGELPIDDEFTAMPFDSDNLRH